MKIDLVIISTSTVEEELKKQLFNFTLISINKNLNWINNIYLVVEDNWVNNLELENSNIKVVKHSEIVPVPQLLKKVSQHNIELFVANIKNLSEHYITIKDTTFILQPLPPESFFKEDKLVFSTVPILTKENLPRTKLIVESYKFIAKTNQISAFIYRPTFGITPWIKSKIKHFLSLYGAKFLWEINQYSWESFYFYTSLNDDIIISRDFQEGLFEYQSYVAGIFKFDLLNNKKRKVITLSNDLTYAPNSKIKLHPTAKQWIIEGLTYRLKNE